MYRFSPDRLILDWIKIGLAALGVASMWLIFWLRPVALLAPAPEPIKHVTPRPSTWPSHLRYVE